MNLYDYVKFVGWGVVSEMWESCSNFLLRSMCFTLGGREWLLKLAVLRAFAGPRGKCGIQIKSDYKVNFYHMENSEFKKLVIDRKLLESQIKSIFVGYVFLNFSKIEIQFFDEHFCFQ